MPSMPWTANGSVEPSHTYVIMATRFTVAKRLNMVSVVTATQTLWSGISAVDGLAGYRLSANPASGTLATLSAWHDQASLTAFVRGEKHSAIVAETRRWMRESAFAQWETAGAELPPGWDEATSRLDASTERGLD